MGEIILRMLSFLLQSFMWIWGWVLHPDSSGAAPCSAGTCTASLGEHLLLRVCKGARSQCKKKGRRNCLYSLSEHHSTTHTSLPALLERLTLDLPFPLLSSPELPLRFAPNKPLADLLHLSSAGPQVPTPWWQWTEPTAAQPCSQNDATNWKSLLLNANLSP